MIIKSLQFSPKYTVRVGGEHSHEIEKRADMFVWTERGNKREQKAQRKGFPWAVWLLCGPESKRNFLISLPWDLFWNIRKTILICMYIYICIAHLRKDTAGCLWEVELGERALRKNFFFLFLITPLFLGNFVTYVAYPKRTNE